MPRNSTGTYSSPSANFVSGTTISSSTMNGKLNDLGSEITDSLSRSGKGGMTAALKLDDGTKAAPGLSFVDDTGIGFYLVGAADMRASSGGNDVVKVGTTEFRVYQAGIYEKGLTVTNSTTSGAGATITGNSPASGDAVGGTGLVVTGGTPSGTGGKGTGIVGLGAGASSTGLTGFGTGGVFVGEGNSSPTTSSQVGTGVYALGGPTVTSGAAGHGLLARGGNPASDMGGTGVFGIGGTPTAGDSNGGVGVRGSGGAASGSGSPGAGAIFAPGAAAAADARTTAVELASGDLVFSSVTNPNGDVAFTNTLTPVNIPKAAIFVSALIGNLTVHDTFNISSATPPAISGGDLVVTFASAFANDDYFVQLTIDATNGVPSPDKYVVWGRTTTAVTIRGLTTSNTQESWGNGTHGLNITVLGRQ